MSRLDEIRARLEKEREELSKIGATTPELGRAYISRDDLNYLLTRLAAAERVAVGVKEIIKMLEADDMQDAPCSLAKQTNIIRWSKDALTAYQDAA